jgi:hypothetical protein
MAVVADPGPSSPSSLPREQAPERLVSLQTLLGLILSRVILVKVSEKFTNLHAQALNLGLSWVIIECIIHV